MFKTKPGRKKVADKKESVTVYIKPSEIISVGGKDELRDQIIAFIETLVFNSKSKTNGQTI